MKKLLNSLYITKQESYIHKERETIVIKHNGEKLAQFPAINVGNIFCFGQVSVSPFLMGYCTQQQIGLAFFTEYGRFLARVEGKPTGNVLLRRQQYRWADDEAKSLCIARLMVAAKITNARSVLQRDQRNHGENAEFNQAIKRLARGMNRAKQAATLAGLRGIEGEIAANYFAVFNGLIRQNGMQFVGRVRRPPTDPINALLSFAYTLITQECVSALAGVGLDPYVGFLHVDRPGRTGLALDLLEEFRSSWAERFVLTQCNRKQITQSDFVTEASGAVRLQDEARKALLMAWQERKQVEIQHPYLQEKVSIGLLPHCQAMLLARHIRGDTRYYPPFIMR